MIVLGVFGGALMAAGAVKTYKAMGEVNTKNASGVVNVNTDQFLEGLSIGAGMRDPSQSDAGPLTQADIEAMRAELDAMDDYVQDPATPNVLPASPWEDAEEAPTTAPPVFVAGDTRR
jgi:hypothetical protein